MEKFESSSHGVSSSTGLDLDNLPYLQRAQRLQKAYPALRPLWQKLTNDADEGRRLIAARHAECHASPARCAVLIFYDDRVEHDATLYTTDELAAYLLEHPTGQSRRLFIMEDTEPQMVDILGQKLGVNPLIFSEQMNTWNFTDCNSVSHRSLPSMAAPESLFTLRYYEVRTLDDADTCPHKNKRHHRARMTHAINRRKIEEWRDLELKSIEPDSKHFFIRRCASFWTSSPHRPAHDWDAVILVDPPSEYALGQRTH